MLVTFQSVYSGVTAPDSRFADPLRWVAGLGKRRVMEVIVYSDFSDDFNLFHQLVSSRHSRSID